MSENFKLNVIAAIVNIISTICFTILAIIFRHWWIILFSALLHVTVERSNKNE